MLKGRKPFFYTLDTVSFGCIIRVKGRCIVFEMTYWLMGIGATMAGVGLGCKYQGEALKRSETTEDIGKKSFAVGAVWEGVGFAALVAGFVIFMLVKFGVIQ